MRYRLAIILLVVAIMIALPFGYRHYRLSIEPDVPLSAPSPRLSADVFYVPGPSVSAEKVRAFKLAGLYLGMPAEEAIAQLQRVSSQVQIRSKSRTSNPHLIIGKAAWTELADANAPDPKSLGLEKPFPTITAISLGSSIWPDGQERLTSIKLVVQMPITPEEIARAGRQDVMQTMVDVLKKQLGTPTVEGRSPRTDEDFKVWGSDPIALSDVSALFTYVRCTHFGAPVADSAFRCDRRKAIHTPWVQIFGRPNQFSLHLQDGAASYLSRYPAGYLPSHPYLIH